MPRGGPHATERDLFARVINAWRKDGALNTEARGALAPTLESFPVPFNTLALLRRDSDVNMVDEEAWVVGRPIEPHDPLIFPVVAAAVAVDGDRVTGTIRVALVHVGTDRPVEAAGWRFESAERGDVDADAGNRPRPHTYPHAQPCSSWRPRHSCLLHPLSEPEDLGTDGEGTVVGCVDCYLSTDEGAPPQPPILSQTRPAFPLRCQTLPGLAVAALAALYGAQVAREVLSHDTRFDGCSPEFAADFRHILGEPEPDLVS